MYCRRPMRLSCLDTCFRHHTGGDVPQQWSPRQPPPLPLRRSLSIHSSLYVTQEAVYTRGSGRDRVSQREQKDCSLEDHTLNLLDLASLPGNGPREDFTMFVGLQIQHSPSSLLRTTPPVDAWIRRQSPPQTEKDPIHTPTTTEGELQLASANCFYDLEEDISLILPSPLVPSSLKSPVSSGIHPSSLSHLIFQSQPACQPCLL
ncbi:hypothetical protein DPX16_4750 [Anabarilius grahami]|uniref:Uncharacterized protein n=1 Tax=Anabarilius grahami TaxID=495550 RepID=A0A3N0YI54_ANAGA|nr:hypothetical protein DPX16_4750 [Anabarilius grahami]